MSATWGQQITIPGLSVAGDLSSKQYLAVKAASTANQIIAFAASTDIALGILQDAPDAANEAATVCALGVTVGVAGTSVLTYGARIQYNTTGEVIVASQNDVGLALEAPGASGDQIKVLLDGGKA